MISRESTVIEEKRRRENEKGKVRTSNMNRSRKKRREGKGERLGCRKFRRVGFIVPVKREGEGTHRRHRIGME